MKFNFFDCRIYTFYHKRFLNVFFPNRRTSFIIYIFSIGIFICSLYEYSLNHDLSKLFLIDLLSFTSAVIGGLFGFLFGMPKNSYHDDHKSTEPKKENNSSKTKDTYQENTNLQEISDWMTKIIVGVGLTQFRSIYGEYVLITSKISSEGGIGPHTIICMITIYFYVLGFFGSYFWAKLDYNEIITSKLNKKINKISKRSEERDKTNLKVLEIASVLDSDKNDKSTKKNYIESLIDIVTSNPMHRMANIILARFYAEVMDDYKAAIGSLDRYISLKYSHNEKDIDLSDAIYNKAFYYMKLGEIEKSLHTFKTCFSIYNQNKHFAKDDPDLKELHSNPEFIKLTS
jgi:hypothetical protein